MKKETAIIVATMVAWAICGISVLFLVRTNAECPLRSFLHTLTILSALAGIVLEAVRRVNSITEEVFRGMFRQEIQQLKADKEKEANFLATKYQAPELEFIRKAIVLLDQRMKDREKNISALTHRARKKREPFYILYDPKTFEFVGESTILLDTEETNLATMSSDVLRSTTFTDKLLQDASKQQARCELLTEEIDTALAIIASGSPIGETQPLNDDLCKLLDDIMTGYDSFQGTEVIDGMPNEIPRMELEQYA